MSSKPPLFQQQSLFRTSLFTESSCLGLQLLHARLHCELVAQQHVRVERHTLMLHAGKQGCNLHLPL